MLEKHRACYDAMFCDSFPVNPIPFAIALTEHLKDLDNGKDIQDDETKRLLWVLMAQAYGQLSEINMVEEWGRLYKLYGSEETMLEQTSTSNG